MNRAHSKRKESNREWSSKEKIVKRSHEGILYSPSLSLLFPLPLGPSHCYHTAVSDSESNERTKERRGNPSKSTYSRSSERVTVERM